jgi:hypothetical protein
MIVNDDYVAPTGWKAVRRWALVIFVFALVAAIPFMMYHRSANPGSAMMRYKLIASIEEDGQLRTGSAIWGISCPYVTGKSPPSGAPCRMAGEALTLTLSNNKKIFILPRSVVKDSAMNDVQLGSQNLLADHIVADARKAVIPSDHIPLMVTFDDPAKPETVRRIDPHNIDANPGSRVILKSLNVAMTYEPLPPSRIDNDLPWLKTHKSHLRPENNGSGDVTSQLTAYDFKWLY